MGAGMTTPAERMARGVCPDCGDDPRAHSWYDHQHRCPKLPKQVVACLTQFCAEQAAWFRRTGHCGACGQPGNYCLCRTPCPCADWHEVGSGLTADPVEVFGVAVVDGQQELFG